MSGRITVVGLGPAGADLLTYQARAVLASTTHRYFRTARHPAAEELWDDGVHYASYDAAYEASDDRAAVYRTIADGLLQAAAQHGHVVYAVPGSAVVGEDVTRLLVEAARRRQVDLALVPGVSFVEAAACALGFDILTDSVRVIDAEKIHEQVGGALHPLLIAQTWRREVLSEVKVALLEHYRHDHWVALVQALGGPGQSVRWVHLADLDRDAEVDPLSCVWVPAPAEVAPGALEAFVELVRKLRGPSGCPWDAEQTHHSLVRHLIGETYEVVAAIEALPPDAPAGDVPIESYTHLEEELGDLLFQVVFHATLAAEAGAFTINDVARAIHHKLVRRHPHVFGALEVGSADEVAASWEQWKAAEREGHSAMDDIPDALPALLLAAKMGRRAAGAGFDWPAGDPAVVEAVKAEVAEVEQASSAAEREEEMGDLLFMVVNWARHLKVDAEAALRGACRKFARRFRVVERLAAEAGLDLSAASLAELEVLWERAKAEVTINPHP